MKYIAILAAFGILFLAEITDRKRNYENSFLQTVLEIITPLTGRF
jgi:hypothetical protein